MLLTGWRVRERGAVQRQRRVRVSLAGSQEIVAFGLLYVVQKSAEIYLTWLLLATEKEKKKQKKSSAKKAQKLRPKCNETLDVDDAPQQQQRRRRRAPIPLLWPPARICFNKSFAQKLNEMLPAKKEAGHVDMFWMCCAYPCACFFAYLATARDKLKVMLPMHKRKLFI